MEDPVAEIPGIIRNLTQGSPSVQQRTLERYFVSDASFIHPVCRVPGMPGSRSLVLGIYQWYKILSPKIELEIQSVAFDRQNLILYVYMCQVLSLAFVPFHSGHARLTTVLRLTGDKTTVASDRSSPYSEGSQLTKESQSLLHGQPTIYRIASQEDFYQPSEFIKFLPTYGIGHLLILLWQYWNTLLSVLGAVLGYPVTMYMEGRDRNKKVSDS